MVKRTFDPHPVFDVGYLLEFLREREIKTCHVWRIYGGLIKMLVLEMEEDVTEVWRGIEGLPKELYDLLPKYFTPLSSKVVRREGSGKGDTTKMVVELQDGLQVESVIMRYDPKKGKDVTKPGQQRQGKARATLCLSSQVGCQMACKFCATGTMGLKGNLNPAEIFEQLVHAMRIEKIRNVVFMGMGEPLNNYKSMVDSIRLMVDSRLFGLAPSHITVSTVGVTNRIRTLASDLPGVNLALSLHAPNQEIRLAIVPTGRAYPVEKLIAACRAWQTQTGGKKVFFEYVVLGGINDEVSHALELGELLSKNEIDGVVNLIPWNPTESGAMEGYQAPAEGKLFAFQRALREAHGIRCTVRREFGQDINSACGQLVINSGASPSVCAPSPARSKAKVGLGLLLDW
ncbi:ribosomal RNA large subunit methyltransferase [Chloropicon primus]|uniref:Ribosomal RNA large subunit methyltransferase n=1 Tax=Chloropicon primus TaxID=1764295 RepID=A0A5B8MKU7_9CHLO|nr:Ribosomal RNA large subunit methyltransferase [Chloropicon primus]UPQ99535.1 ribosomal RNA large subunit methyltransferase [Chloropicon primus]|mmetsp:Transcript_2242/g.6108  ORF Transcript_2242/g.6108 Transcript_2242/m.6108 type:complete len:401 (+) Transcript_2242:1710-2912(+)|eukprot:QDZ20325.1 Ribosomal RNA large subunit methyltransferase [Chloropicon primus]